MKSFTNWIEKIEKRDPSEHGLACPAVDRFDCVFSACRVRCQSWRHRSTISVNLSQQPRCCGCTMTTAVTAGTLSSAAQGLFHPLIIITGWSMHPTVLLFGWITCRMREENQSPRLPPPALSCSGFWVCTDRSTLMANHQENSFIFNYDSSAVENLGPCLCISPTPYFLVLCAALWGSY